MRFIKQLCLIVFGLLLTGAVAVAGDVSNALGSLTESKKLTSPDSTNRFYSEWQFSLQWSSRNLKALMNSIQDSYSHGLSPEDYHLGELGSKTESSEVRDVLATDAYLTLAGHLLGGKVNPVTIEPAWTAKRRERDLVAYLSAAISEGNISKSLEILAPSDEEYVQLRKALVRYRKLDDNGGWKPISAGERIKPGAKSLQVEAIRSRLEISGDIVKVSENRELYDLPLQNAVKKFQQRINLNPDGLIGSETIKNLNLSPEQRIDQLRINLERWRWLPDSMGSRHIRVNIADYRLEVYEGAKVKRVHDVIIGRTYRKTPIFSAEMSYIVLNPWWNIPGNLTRQDILPKIWKKPGTAESMGYQISDRNGNVLPADKVNWSDYSTSNFPYQVRQKPGVQNALGQVKFMFPNKHNVYLHDTSSRELFDKTQRDFSSGCIRVKDPLELANWVLQWNKDWSRSRMEAELKSGKEKVINLQSRIPVHLLYWTVVADIKNNGIRFINDVYNRDNKVLQALNAVHKIR